MVIALLEEDFAARIGTVGDVVANTATDARAARGIETDVTMGVE